MAKQGDKGGLALARIVEQRILLLRGEKVMLDADLAELYGVETRYVARAVGRNKDRFPSDFMFRLTREEDENLKSQFGISSWGGRRRSRPLAFTEQGVAMLSSVLRSKRAASVNIEIMRAFVKLRRLLNSHEELAGKLRELEKKYDANFKVVFDALRKLMQPSENEKKERIGFVVRPKNKGGKSKRKPAKVE